MCEGEIEKLKPQRGGRGYFFRVGVRTGAASNLSGAERASVSSSAISCSVTSRTKKCVHRLSSERKMHLLEVQNKHHCAFGE